MSIMIQAMSIKRFHAFTGQCLACSRLDFERLREFKLRTLDVAVTLSCHAACLRLLLVSLAALYSRTDASAQDGVVRGKRSPTAVPITFRP